MVVGLEEKLADTAVRAQELAVGEMVTFKSGQGIREIVFGRNPTSKYEDAPEHKAFDVTQGIFPVKLLGAQVDTSRQQFGIARDGKGPFILTNYSQMPLHIENGRGEKFDLNPNMQMPLAQNTQEMQRVKIGWRKHYEVSVQGIGTNSGDKNWSVDFKWGLVNLR